MNPAIVKTYEWFLRGYSSLGSKTYSLNDILIMNEHGTLWFCGTGRLSQKLKEGKYTTLHDALNLSPEEWE